MFRIQGLLEQKSLILTITIKSLYRHEIPNLFIYPKASNTDLASV